MTKHKQIKLVEELGQNMAESTGALQNEDRFAGSKPSEIKVVELLVEQIVEDDSQPRKSMDPESLQELANNIKSHGIQSPIKVRWSDWHQKWMIVFGHRRFRASKLADMETIPATIANDEWDENTIRVMQLIENCQREDLPPIELADAIEALVRLTGWSNRQVGQELSLSHVSVARFRELTKLPDDIKSRVNSGEIAQAVASQIAKIKGHAKQSKIGNEIATGRLNRTQALQKIKGLASPTKPTGKNVKSILFNSENISVYRNPEASDFKIQKELMELAGRLDSTKSEP